MEPEGREPSAPLVFAHLAPERPRANAAPADAAREDFA